MVENSKKFLKIWLKSAIQHRERMMEMLSRKPFHAKLERNYEEKLVWSPFRLQFSMKSITFEKVEIPINRKENCCWQAVTTSELSLKYASISHCRFLLSVTIDIILNALILMRIDYSTVQKQYVCCSRRWLFH